MLDLDIVDAHHHLWTRNETAQDKDETSDRLAFIGDESSIAGDYLPDDLRADAGDLRLIGSVHVEAGPPDYLDEARWLQQVQSSAGLPTAIVAGASLLDPATPAHVHALAELPAVRGIRDTLCWHPDPRYTFTDRDDIITDETWLTNFRLLSGLGLSFDLQLYPAQLQEGARLAAEHPDTRLILVHTGMPFGSDPEPFGEWRAGIRALAAQPNATAKISGLGMMDHDWTVESIRPYVEEVIDAFGPGRTMFASNFPVDGLYSSYAELYGAFDSLTAGFSRTEREALFATTAIEVYRLPENLLRRTA